MYHVHAACSFSLSLSLFPPWYLRSSRLYQIHDLCPNSSSPLENLLKGATQRPECQILAQAPAWSPYRRAVGLRARDQAPTEHNSLALPVHLCGLPAPKHTEHWRDPVASQAFISAEPGVSTPSAPLALSSSPRTWAASRSAWPPVVTSPPPAKWGMIFHSNNFTF